MSPFLFSIMNSSTFLFSIFLDDMLEIISHVYKELDVPTNCTSQMLSDDDIVLYLKLHLLL